MDMSDHLPVPPASLDGPDRARLDGYALRAVQRQQRMLEQATDEALDHVPRPVRGLVRRILAP